MILQEKNTIADALNTISGISVNNLGMRGETSVSIRGFSATHSPVFIDGIAMNVPYDGYIDFSNFTTFDLEKIQVSKGLSSPLLGVNAFAGAVNLVTKKPTKKFEGTASAGAFNGNGKKGYLNLGTNQGLYYVQASASYLDKDYTKMSKDFKANSHQDNKRRVNSYKEDRKLNLKVGYTPNETDEYAINYINQKTEKGIPPSAKVNSTQYRQWPYSNKNSFYFLSNTNFKIGYLKSRIFYDKFENNMLFFKDKSFKELSFPPTPYDANTKGLSLELGQYDNVRNSLKLALHTKQDTQKEIHSDGQSFIKQMQYLSFGLEDTFKVTNSFKVIAGASLDKDEVKKANNEKYDPSGTGWALVKEFEHKSSSAFNPMIKFEYDIDETAGLYAGVAKKSKFGTLKDRYSFRMGRTIPNPDLKPEKAINYEIGANKVFQNQGIKSALFYTDAKDFIQLVNVGGGLSQQQNVGEVKHMGYELEYFYAFDNNLDFDANYTRLLAKDKKKEVDITNVPKHKIALALTYRPIKALSTNINMQYASSRHTSANNRSRDVSSASIWNAKIAYELVKGLTFDVGASNIFDKDYEYNWGYPEAGRVIFSNLTYRF